MSIKTNEMERISRRLSVSSNSSANVGSSDWNDSGALGSVPTLLSVYTNTPGSFPLLFWLSASIWLQLASRAGLLPYYRALRPQGNGTEPSTSSPSMTTSTSSADASVRIAPFPVEAARKSVQRNGQPFLDGFVIIRLVTYSVGGRLFLVIITVSRLHSNPVSLAKPCNFAPTLSDGSRVPSLFCLSPVVFNIPFSEEGILRTSGRQRSRHGSCPFVNCIFVVPLECLYMSFGLGTNTCELQILNATLSPSPRSISTTSQRIGNCRNTLSIGFLNAASGVGRRPPHSQPPPPDLNDRPQCFPTPRLEPGGDRCRSQSPTLVVVCKKVWSGGPRSTCEVNVPPNVYILGLWGLGYRSLSAMRHEAMVRHLNLTSYAGSFGANTVRHEGFSGRPKRTRHTIRSVGSS